MAALLRYERARPPIHSLCRAWRDVSRDWHPPTSAHFQRWPAYCVAGTAGAAFHPALELPAEATVVSKGTDPADDGGYSAFDGTELESGRSLCDLLRSAGVTHLLVGGLATDYCVRASVLDARRAGFEVTVLLDAIRGIDIEPGDLACAVAEMAAAGARFARSVEVLRDAA